MATFRGGEFFSYNLSQSPIQSSVDELTLSFRTLQRNGLLLHTGRSADYVNLSLRNGALWLVINLGSGAFEALVEPTSGKFNDNNWHDVRVTRNRRQVCPHASEYLSSRASKLISVPRKSPGVPPSAASAVPYFSAFPGTPSFPLFSVSESIVSDICLQLRFYRAHLPASVFMNGC